MQKKQILQKAEKKLCVYNSPNFSDKIINTYLPSSSWNPVCMTWSQVYHEKT